jgi:hypothetical protein
VGHQIADVSINLGVLKVGVVGFALPFVLVAVDALIAGRGKDTYVGHWAQAWARRFPAFALAIAVVIGALVGHFYWAA